MTIRDILPQTFRARELLGDFWLNSEPVQLAALRGQVILLEFWDYTSAESLRTLPYLLEWRRRYAPSYVVVVGVHTPRFPFGRNPAEVQKAVTRLGIDFPVVMDNEGLIAAHYDSRRLPEMVLIDKDGFIRYRNAGEGNYGVVEHALQSLLYSAGMGGEFPALMEPVRESDRAGSVCYRPTPELFAGYLRGSIGNSEGYAPESVLRYSDPGIYLDGRFYVDGPWLNGRDSLRLEGGGKGGGIVIVPYNGLDAEGVLAPEGSKSVEITVRQDGEFLNTQNKGEDVRIDKKGRSYLVLNAPRLYGIARNNEFGEHLLKLSGSHPFSVYAFSFTTAAIPELLSPIPLQTR